MEKIEHKTIPLNNGLKMHVAELGQGPIVLFLHGFPELWYSWRHQMVYMAAHGYHAVAPDLRGYGDTTNAPIEDPSKFSNIHIVGDLILLLNEILSSKEEKVFVVGHDWGAVMAWDLCLYRPDKVKALVNLSVPFPRKSLQMNYVDAMRHFYGNNHYICVFQEPGVIEAEFANIGVKEVIKNILAYRKPEPFYISKGKGFGYSADRPDWLTEEDLDYFTTKFEQTGFTGGVNYYRSLGLTWEQSLPWTGAQVKVPTKFVIGDLDLVYHIPGIKEYIHKGEFQKDVPDLQEIVVIEGAAHFITQERPDEVNEHIYSLLQQF